MSILLRNLQNLAEIYLKQFPVIAILGPRQVGKTTFAKLLRPTWKYFDLESTSSYQLIAQDPELFFQQYYQSIIIDEAQELPILFKILRGVIDDNRDVKGRFIITGSSSPDLIHHLADSLAGRIGILRLGLLKANEYYQRPLSDFYNIFKQKLDKSNINFDSPAITNNDMRYCWLKGGFPEPLLAADDNDFYQHWMQNYQDTYINRDIAHLFSKLNYHAYQRFLSTLSRLSGTIINKADIARAIEISEGSVREYLEIAEATFLWRIVPYYSRNAFKSLVKRPKGYIVDTGLLHYLLRIDNMDNLLLDPKVGSSFEGFIISEIVNGLEAANISNWDIYFYRTHNGAEVDLIIEGAFGTLPIEIKMGSHIPRKNLKSLIQFIEQNNLPFGMVINQSSEVFWLHPKVIQIPIRYL